jgi:hypothetical protein
MMCLSLLALGAAIVGASCFIMGAPEGLALGLTALLILFAVVGWISLALRRIDPPKRHLNFATVTTILSRPDRQRRDRVITSPKGEPS